MWLRIFVGWFLERFPCQVCGIGEFSCPSCRLQHFWMEREKNCWRRLDWLSTGRLAQSRWVCLWIPQIPWFLSMFLIIVPVKIALYGYTMVYQIFRDTQRRSWPPTPAVFFGSSLQLNQLGFFSDLFSLDPCANLCLHDRIRRFCVLSIRWKVWDMLRKLHERTIQDFMKGVFNGISLESSPLSRHCGRWEFKFLDVIGVWSIGPCTPYLDDCKAINYILYVCIYIYIYIFIHTYIYTYIFIHTHTFALVCSVTSICHFSWWDILKRNHLQRHSWPRRWLVFL